MNTQHKEMRGMLNTINQMRQDACERKTAEKLWKKSDVRSAILIAANSPELVRVCDAWRVYDFALNKRIVPEVKFVLRVLNPTAFSAMCEYEAEEIEGAVRAAIARATGQPSA